MDQIQLPQNVLDIMAIIKEYGAESYVVGGCVRDSLLGRDPKDWDICSPVPAAELELHFKDKGYRTIDTGVKHGTISVVIGSNLYEVTTFRKDGKYSDGRHPDNIEFISDLQEDLARRDFTINAIAYNPEAGLIDPFGGMKDLSRNVLCCVGNPRQRLQEDALRILRALRFASTYNFQIEKRTSQTMLVYAPLLRNIAMERINKEFTSILLYGDATDILIPYRTIIEQFIPEINVYDDALYRNICFWINAAPIDVSIRLAILLSSLYEYQTPLTNLRYDNITVKDVCTLIDHFNDIYFTPVPSVLKRHLRDYGAICVCKLLYMKDACPTTTEIQQVRYMKSLRVLNTIRSNNECYSLRQLNINGRDLIRQGMKPGKAIGELLNQLLDEVICGTLDNDPIMLLARAGVLIKEGDYT